MAQPYRIKWLPAAADDDNIATTQTPAGAGNLTLDGVGVTAGVATISSANCSQRRVLITTVSNESAKTITIYGTRPNGTPISETMTGPNATTGSSLLDYATVTRIAVSAALTGAIIAGTGPISSTPWFVPNRHIAPFAIGFGCTVGGTINFDVEHTFSNPDPDLLNPDNTLIPNVFDHSTVAAKTASIDNNYAFPCAAFRLTINTYTTTGYVIWEVIQGGVHG